MPGSSLWLLPPETHPIDSLLTSLISKTSSRFSSSHLFIPHVTLTSNINPDTYGSEPQKWLDALPFPEGKDVVVKLGSLQSEPVFVRKLYSKVESEGVRKPAKVARMVVESYTEEIAAEEWVNREFMPHLSLLYHDCPQVNEKELKAVEGIVQEAGVQLDGKGELGGWVGGRVVLVPTDKAIKDWKAVATREL